MKINKKENEPENEIETHSAHMYGKYVRKERKKRKQVAFVNAACLDFVNVR